MLLFGERKRLVHRGAQGTLSNATNIWVIMTKQEKFSDSLDH
jgi:hypothetical protein